MTSCREIITRGLKMAKVIGLNDSPSANEAAEGLDILQSLYQSWVSSGEFGTLKDVYTGSDYTALEQERVTTVPGVVITLPDTYSAASDIYGSGEGQRRAPRELSLISVVKDGEETPTVWDGSSWVPLFGLGLNTDAPLDRYGSAGLSACFAMHFADTFGSQIGAGTKLLSDRFISAMRSRRNVAAPPITAEFF